MSSSFSPGWSTKLADGLFLECFHKVSAEYEEIEADERIVDNPGGGPRRGAGRQLR